MKLPKGPTLRLPGRGKGAPGVAKASGPVRSGIQPPGFVNNLYRDLRDRRLLVPAIALAIAVIAVPVMLGSDPEPAPLAAAPVVPADATAVEPAVLAEQLSGVRDYRERLDALKQKNPFKQQFLIPPPKEESVDSVDSSTADKSSGASSTAGLAPSTSTGSGSSVATEPTTTTPSTEPDRDPTIYLYAARIDLVIAHDGRRKKYESVRPGQLLPDRSTPIAMFLSAPNSLETARFLLSSDVVATEGDGHCAPNAADCEFLKLALGDKRVIEYGTPAEKYSFKLTDIRRVLIDQTKRG